MDANQVINGTYGHVYDENGSEQSTTQEFEAVVEFEKEEVRLPGQFMAGHKVMGGSGSGSMMFLKVDSRLQRKIAENPTAKYNYIGQLKDPTSKGEEKVLLIGVSFDSVPLAGHSIGELVEVELDFTFDNYRYLNSIN
ncbi:phage tail tube protein [Cytobacillus horneckiae]|uniref:phage tail tube protein n=1 Tax=Cytobacillus horneckiae TaxID=549687 RepID=UPI003D9A8335